MIEAVYSPRRIDCFLFCLLSAKVLFYEGVSARMGVVQNEYLKGRRAESFAKRAE